MPKLRQLEARLQELQALRHQPAGDRSIAVLRRALQSSTGVLVGNAARTAIELRLERLIPDLLEAFDRLTHDPVQTDPGCLGKVEIVDALRQFGQREYDLFLAGSQYQQWEPIWGGREDRASHLRGRCALALADLGYADTLLVCGDLLADPDVETRVGAADAIARYGSVYGIPLLRLRALSGERSPQVLETMFASLLALCPEKTSAIALIARFLDSELDDVPAVAAIALGDARHPEALVKLRAWSEMRATSDIYRTAYAAIVALRLSEAFDYLIAKVESGTAEESSMARDALIPYRTDIALWERVERAWTNREF
ncbi:MAG: hypothetical protein AAFX40_01760 [Cyanobacteria bacterium J06639_1]